MASENDKTASSSGKEGTASGGGADNAAGKTAGAKAAAGARAKPVTIDLKAEEVLNEKAKAEARAKAEAALKGAEAAKSADKSAASDKNATTDKSSGAEKPYAKADDAAEKTKKSEDKGKGAMPKGSGAMGSGQQGSSGVGRQILTAAIGGGIALAGAFVVGQFSGGRVDGALEDLQLTFSDTDARFRQLETQITELKQVEAGPSVAPSMVEELTARVDALKSNAEQISEGAQSDRQSAESLRADMAVLTEGLAEIRRFVSTGAAGESAAVASLSSTVEEMKAALATVTTQLEGDIGERLGKLESGSEREAALSKALDGVEERLATLDGRINQAAEAASAAAKAVTEGDTVTGSTITALSERVDTLAKGLSKADKETTGLDGRIMTATMRAETFTKELEGLSEKLDAMSARITEIETVVGGPGAREMASRAVAVSLLKNAVDSGRPFATEIAAVRVALPADTDLSALEQSEDTGIVPTTRLIAQFPDVARVMAGTLEKVDTGNSVVDKFLNNARSLVSVRATGDVVGGGPMASIGRMEARVREGDLDAALEIYETLPDGTQAAGKEWAAAARGRLSADRLVDQVTADVIKALAASDS